MIEQLTGEIAKFAYETGKKSVERMAESPKGVSWTWDTIRNFGEAKVLRTSFLFLFLVPVIARLLANVPDEVIVPLFNKSITIPLDLPFSWFVLFLSACFASIGNIIYAILCPELIKQYKDFPAYIADERDGTHLLPYLKKISFQSASSETSEHVEAVRRLYNNSPISSDDVADHLQGKRTLNPRTFYFMRDSVNLAQPLVRLGASVSYFFAFICLGVIAVQNIYFVFGYMLR